MKGSIEIRAQGENELSIHYKMSQISNKDKLMIFDALTRAMKFDKTDRRMVGMMIALGGMEAMTGVAPDVVAVDMGLINICRNKDKEGNLTQEG